MKARKVLVTISTQAWEKMQVRDLNNLGGWVAAALKSRYIDVDQEMVVIIQGFLCDNQCRRGVLVEVTCFDRGTADEIWVVQKAHELAETLEAGLRGGFGLEFARASVTLTTDQQMTVQMSRLA